MIRPGERVLSMFASRVVGFHHGLSARIDQVVLVFNERSQFGWGGVIGTRDVGATRVDAADFF